MIKVQNLYHSYTDDHNYAVKDINFEIAKGVFGKYLFLHFGT
ncbi:hypothetical protein CACET_c23080 [Clostridium aceticum]|uniref:ABC transporter ATP-binding protein n=1 Tax=Clostridium aceticum TaxID=84022 RepID=A0A0G3WE99_9CLOT|nr:hypothetical protein [Clostridium aceticum]AKL95754.1 hypothetical protein CACET_c23080 [Clostridium aceticum]